MIVSDYAFIEIIVSMTVIESDVLSVLRGEGLEMRKTLEIYQKSPYTPQ
jgi:hypothetical protein